MLDGDTDLRTHSRLSGLVTKTAAKLFKSKANAAGLSYTCRVMIYQDLVMVRNRNLEWQSAYVVHALKSTDNLKLSDQSALIAEQTSEIRNAK